MAPVTLVVTRHPALVELLRERGLCSHGTPVVAHVADPATLDGQHVCGVLPLHLAVRCASVTEIPLAITEAERRAGAELALERLREIAGAAVTYAVTLAR
jgi:hypothetical protein